MLIRKSKSHKFFALEQANRKEGRFCGHCDRIIEKKERYLKIYRTDGFKKLVCNFVCNEICFNNLNLDAKSPI